jgi:hypothetical protein
MMSKLYRDDDRSTPGFMALASVLPRAADYGRTQGLSLAATLALCFVCIWSLLELPWEIGPSGSSGQIAALLISKVVLIGLALLVLRRRSGARYVFLLLCGMSMFALAWSLPAEYERSFSFAVLSTVECLGRSAAFIFLALCSVRKGITSGTPVATPSHTL